MSNQPVSSEHILKQPAPSPSLQEAPATHPQTPTTKPPSQRAVRLAIDVIVRVETGLFFIGGLYDPDHEVETFGLLASGQLDTLIPFSPPHPALRIQTRLRPVPMDNASPEDVNQNEFVAFLTAKAGMRVHLAVRLRNGETLVQAYPTVAYSALNATHLTQLGLHSEDGLLELAESVLDPNHGFTAALRKESRQAVDGMPGLCIDHALYTESALLCLYGWSASPAHSIRRLFLLAPETQIELTERIHRLPRPDLTEIFPELRDGEYGFFGLLALAPKQLSGARLHLEMQDGHRTTLFLKPKVVEWTEFAVFMRSLWCHAMSDLPTLLGHCRTLKKSRLTKRLTHLATSLVETHHADLPLSVSAPAEHGMIALDRAWALGAGGCLLTGWRFDPYGTKPRIFFHSPAGQSLEITDCLFPVPRPDVADVHRDHFPEMTEDTGFLCRVPFPTNPGDTRLIELRRAPGQSRWLRLPDTRVARSDTSLINDILSWVPQPQRMRRRLYALFNDHLGPTLDAIEPRSPPATEDIATHAFGVPPEAPRVSILVPLYGRYDFLRHQLAQFADDPDFQAVDLLYLVDDPRILTETLELASAVQPLFGVSFRVAHAGANLGYAAINNLGARFARADTLLLLNSDILPLHPGWLATLLDALEHLPEAGAVAPLLLFPEGAVQHAGMVAGEHPAFPGFLFNLHPGKGQAWNGPETPSEQIMLSAACLLLRTADYLACGGLDEGYRVGDFEDSDLCLVLRQRGRRLYLAPAAKLCHLERQSQQLAEQGDRRMLLTLYNAWRFGDKIRAGRFPDPRLAMEA
ncbi:glycosyltransferase [Thiocystis minor]|uniref:glycosyltransferase n=1 Tax=Thiocystis minor TaxID=61597 RepID=UPI0019148AA5|nr:glycosyltransferase [Thiocystis minor]